MTTRNDFLDDEIARLTARRTLVRAAIDKQLAENMSIGQFEGITITRITIDNLERQERALNHAIDRAIAEKHGESWDWGRAVVYKPENPRPSSYRRRGWE